MNVRWLMLPVALSAGCQLASQGRDELSPTVAHANPSIRFLRPINGEHFTDLPIYVQVDVARFNLVPPSKQANNAAPANSGYVRYSMDDYPICGTDETQVMIGKFLGSSYIPVGWHTVKAELVDSNGNPLNPPVVAETRAFSGHSAAMETDHQQGGSVQAEVTAQKLYKMRLQLQTLKDELQKIRSGNPGFVPVPMSGGEHRGE